MLLKSATSLAFAAACMTAIAIAPGAQAQSASPNGTAGSTYQNQMQTPPSNASSDWSRGGNGSTTGNYTPQSYRGNAMPSAAGTSGDQLITNGPQSNGVEQSGNWSARANVIQSRRYQRLVDTNGAFRAARMRKECGPITDAQLHAQCAASFNQGGSNTMSGSSTAPSNYGNGSGS